MTENRYIRIVSLWLRDGDVAAFESFEREAARLMTRHGGRIEQPVRVTQGEGRDDPFEIHVVSFPHAAGFETYMADPDVAGRKALRERVISRSEVLAGRPAGPY
ncbi:MAG: hypothetical protein SGJ21_06235 [Alphaproteobacteria bacterium]|nr:hypothetical protein [Alphaproteobacteria bacterium]